jgi:hypothetical protein
LQGYEAAHITPASSEGATSTPNDAKASGEAGTTALNEAASLAAGKRTNNPRGAALRGPATKESAAGSARLNNVMLEKRISIYLLSCCSFRSIDDRDLIYNLLPVCMLCYSP